MKREKSLKRYLKWAGLSVLSGLLAGLAATLFLVLLAWATNFRGEHALIIFALPLAGLAIGLVYHHFGRDVEGGNNLILDEIHDPKKIVPIHMAPFILIGTVLTHLFGGSAREGTAVQMGASLSDQLTRFFTIEPDERKILLMAGAGAGFGAAIGAPWAGAIFGMEVIYVGRFSLFGGVECVIASFVGYYTTIFLHAPHSHYPPLPMPSYDLTTFFYVAIAGMIFGGASQIFMVLTHVVERAFKKWIHYPPLKPFIGGLLVLGFFYWEGSYKFVGLGIPWIQHALAQQVGFSEPVYKAIATALTIGSGFKGGEFIPLVFIGTTLGSALSLVVPGTTALFASTGFAAVFGAAAKTPLACSIMAIEIFGPQIGPYAFIACFVSYFFSGRRGIYKSQKYYIPIA